MSVQPRKRRFWTDEETQNLIAGIEKVCCCIGSIKSGRAWRDRLLMICSAYSTEWGDGLLFCAIRSLSSTSELRWT